MLWAQRGVEPTITISYRPRSHMIGWIALLDVSRFRCRLALVVMALAVGELTTACDRDCHELGRSGGGTAPGAEKGSVDSGISRDLGSRLVR